MRRWTMMMVLTLAATAALWASAGSATAGGGCHGAPPGAGAGTTVKMDQNCFYPAVLYAAPGDRITWINSESVAHTVTGVGDAWGSYDSVRADARASYGFEAEGVYVYSCIIHPGMVGAVVVGDGVGDEALDPAAVVALPASDDGAAGAEPRPAAASVTVERGDGWVPVTAAIAVGIALAALGLIGVAKSRGRRRTVASV